MRNRSNPTARDRAQATGRRTRHRWRQPLTAEQKAYKAARMRANLKLSFVAHGVVYASVCFMLLFVAGFRVFLFVSLAWGVGLVSHYFMALVAPGLRRRFIAAEVDRELEQNVERERRTLEGKHARSLEQLSASIAHEIRNPITAAKSLVQQMGEDPSSNESVEFANVALEELDRVERSISHLLRFAREEEIQVRDVRMTDVFESALETFRERIGRSGVTVQRDFADGGGTVQGDPEKLRRVIINLIGNALDALEQSEVDRPSIDVMAGDNLAGTEVWVRIRDNGPGIDPASLNKIFSPFYTSKNDGTGLGLAISKKVVDAHGGSLEVNSSPENGTEFLLTLPKRASQTAARE